MKKTSFLIILFALCLSGYAQEDWFGFNRFKADNDRIIAEGSFHEVVFMGNSISDNWAYYHPEFFSENNFCGRGISGQTIAEINQSLRDYAEANDIDYVDYHSTLADERLDLPASLSEDGCHPSPDTYYLMEGMVLEAIHATMK